MMTCWLNERHNSILWAFLVQATEYQVCEDVKINDPHDAVEKDERDAGRVAPIRRDGPFMSALTS